MRNLKMCLTLWALVLMAMAWSVPSAWGAAPELPQLNWQERSDWINVKTDVKPAALGDGKADDTAAIQAAIDQACKQGDVAYLPAGTYRITASLHTTGKVVGLTMIGHGRDTRIVWDGPDGKAMFVCHGSPDAIYRGIIFDGQNKAKSGIFNDGKAMFSTRERYQDMGFVNLQFGVRNDKQPATAEAVYQNCLFEHCTGAGALIYAFNIYNHVFHGCAFRNGGTGIFFKFGQGNVYDCHFENNKRDIYARGEHGVSVRRCTSQGSGLFLEQSGSVCPVTIEDCAVSNWRNKNGALRLRGSRIVAALVFDCTFTNPPAGYSPAETAPINVAHPKMVIVSNNHVSGTANIVAAGKTVGKEVPVWRVPAGERSGTSLSADHSFLKSRVDVAGAVGDKIYNVKTEFGAKGDGKADDTAALQKAIDAARQHGDGALAYLPAGSYRVTKPLTISGADYAVGGTNAVQSRVIWDGPEDGKAVCIVSGPQRVTVQHIAFRSAGSYAKWGETMPSVLQVSNGKPSSVYYDNIYVYGKYWTKKTRPMGMVLAGLGPDDVVRIGHLDGELRVKDSARAHILVNYQYGGVIHVSGKGKQRDGLFGILFKLQTGMIGPFIRIQDNQSLVLGDLYCESSSKVLSIAGEKGDPAGRVVIQGVDTGAFYKPEKHDPNPQILIDNYKGLFSYGPTQFYDYGKKQWKVSPVIKQTGTRPVDVIFMGVVHYVSAPFKLEMGPGARLTMLANNWHENVVPDEVKLKPVSQALDQLRALGAMDLKLNGFIEQR